MTAKATFPAERTAVLTGAASPRGIGRATAFMDETVEAWERVF